MLDRIFKATNPWTYIEPILLDACKGIVLSSYWICLIGGLIGLILFIFGWKKGKEISCIAPVIYLLIRILGGVLLGI